nr:alpha/beta hydrolase [Paraburkholderia phenoliruptrix]
MPGLLCDRAVWASQCDELSDIANCIVPNYGTLRTISDMAQFVLDSVPGRFAVAGHSMGGRVALEVVCAAPSRVIQLALLDTGYEARQDGSAGEEEKASRLRLLDLAYRKGMRAVGIEWTPGMVRTETLDTPVYQAILDMIERSSPDLFEAQIHALLTRPDATRVLSEIRCPTLLLCGREDRWSPVARHEAMHKAIENSVMCVVEEAGHMVTMEQPVAVNAALRDWLLTESEGEST